MGLAAQEAVVLVVVLVALELAALGLEWLLAAQASESVARPLAEPWMLLGRQESVTLPEELLVVIRSFARPLETVIRLGRQAQRLTAQLVRVAESSQEGPSEPSS